MIRRRKYNKAAGNSNRNVWIKENNDFQLSLVLLDIARDGLGPATAATDMFLRWTRAHFIYNFTICAVAKESYC